MPFFFFSCKVPDTISVTTQLCNSSTKAAIDSMQMNRRGAVPIKLYTNSQRVGFGSQDIVWWSLLYQIVSFWGQCISRVIVSIQWYFPSAWRNPFNILKMLMAINSLCLCLNGIVFISPSVLKGTFNEYRILGQLFFPSL